MIHSHQTFSYKDRILIERLKVSPPFKHKVNFQNEGCFLYVSGHAISFSGANETEVLNGKQGILLKCGKYFVDWITKDNIKQDLEITAIHLYPDVLKELYKNELPKTISEKLTHRRMAVVESNEVIDKFIENLIYYFDKPALVNDDLLELKMKELVLLLIQSKSAMSVLQLLEDLFTPREVSIKEVVATHLYSNLKISELADLCNMSDSSFRREFQKIYNASPVNFLNNQKILKAKELLLVGKHTIAEIAYEVGFDDPAYFARIFKKIVGVSPKNYRKQPSD